MLLDENKKTDNKGIAPEAIGVKTPQTKNVDETEIYDLSLINNLKTKFFELFISNNEKRNDMENCTDDSFQQKGSL